MDQIDDDDKKNLYEVAELQEYNEVSGYKSQPLQNTKKDRDVWKTMVLVFLVMVVLLQILLIILSSVAVYDLRINPSVCSVESSNTLTGARTGGDSTGNCSSNNTELLKLLNDLVSLNDLQLMYTVNNPNILI